MLLQDLRYGARLLARNPGTTAATVLALALGIGVNTAGDAGQNRDAAAHWSPKARSSESSPAPATLEEMLHQTAPFITATLAAAVSSSIGIVGLLLALMGIYGTVSYIVVLRTREVGIRMAIGAQKRDVLLLILRESTLPVFAGLVLGATLAAAASHLARGMLYGFNGIDVFSVVGVSALFLAIGLLASFPPARRAMGADPLVALRYE